MKFDPEAGPVDPLPGAPARPVDHVGIVVRSIAEAAPLFEGLLGQRASDRESLPEHGVDVWDWKEPGVSQFFPMPTVFFNGDENEGDRAAGIMWEHGVYIWRVRRNWHYDGHEEPHRSHWEMLF